MEVNGGKELANDLRIIVQVEGDDMLNAKLLHQIQSFFKVVMVLFLPHVMHVNPVNFHVVVLLGLDHI